MATYNNKQIAFIILVFILLILSIVLVIMTATQKSQKNMNSFDFYQKKKILFDLDDGDISSAITSSNKIPQSISQNNNIKSQSNNDLPQSNDITFAVIDT